MAKSCYQLLKAVLPPRCCQLLSPTYHHDPDQEECVADEECEDGHLVGQKIHGVLAQEGAVIHSQVLIQVNNFLALRNTSDARKAKAKLETNSRYDVTIDQQIPVYPVK
jgi:hypothetical protein